MQERYFQDLRAESNKYHVKHSNKVWERLEQRLEGDLVVKKMQRYRLIAASLLLITLSVSSLYILEKSTDPESAGIQIAETSQLTIEDLTWENEPGIYQVGQLRTLTSYYEKSRRDTEKMN